VARQSSPAANASGEAIGFIPAGSNLACEANINEFVAYAKANPGKINMASTGNGATPHVTGELFKMMAGVDMVHVPYRGAAPAITDLLSGQVQVLFISPLVSIEHIKTGRLRALAVTTAMRSDALPGIPTMGEFVPGYEASTWYGVGAPKATPAEVVDKLNKEINAASPIPRCKHGLPTLEARRLSSRPATLQSSLPPKPKSGVIRALNIKAE
jgi:tripartite-type tricarboxylate transporter receptor subunit TctC